MSAITSVLRSPWVPAAPARAGPGWRGAAGAAVLRAMVPGRRRFLAVISVQASNPVAWLMSDHGAGRPRFAEARPEAAVAARFQDEIMPHLSAAHNLARFLSRDAEAAQDIVQESYLRAFRAYGGFRGGNARAWILAIVRNCCRSWLERQVRDRAVGRSEAPPDRAGGAGAAEGDPPEPASDGDTPEDALIRSSEAEMVRAIVAALPETYREVLVLREFEDLSYREIAEITAAPIGTVMARISRARKLFGERWQRRAGAAEDIR